MIALGFLGASLALSDLIGNVSDSGFAAVLREGFIIGGWVAMWRPLEVFLYDWWPIRGEVRLLDHLSEIPVRIEYNEKRSDDAWRADWPAVPRSRSTASQPRMDMDNGSRKRPAMPPENMEHRHTPEEEREIREAALDQTIEASFPASDPPSSNPNPDDHAALERSPDR